MLSPCTGASPACRRRAIDRVVRAQIAALAVALKYAASPEFKAYAKQVRPPTPCVLHAWRLRRGRSAWFVSAVYAGRARECTHRSGTAMLHMLSINRSCAARICCVCSPASHC